MAIYPYSGGRYDKFWKYENDDPSSDAYAIKVVVEILYIIQDYISKRGKQIYNVRSEAIIVQTLRHATIRELLKILTEQVEIIEKYEKENSGYISNYFDSEGVEHVPEEEEEGDNDNDIQGNGESEISGKFPERGDDDMEYDPE